MSAVLVKMPPPAFANRASELAPKLKPSSAFVSRVIRITSAAPSSVPPTTAMPITAPPRKPAMNDGLMPLRAASAVFTLAMVEMRMPKTPAMAEKSVPHR